MFTFQLYLFPSLTIGGTEVHSQTGEPLSFRTTELSVMLSSDVWGMMTNNLRIYSTLFLLLEFCIVAMGVRFVQLLAPVSFDSIYPLQLLVDYSQSMILQVSLVCVIASILACYAGGVAKTLMPDSGMA